MGHDYFVLLVTNEDGPGMLAGPGTWKQCVTKGLELIHLISDTQLAEDESADFEQGGIWCKGSDAEGVYILLAEPFQD